MKKIILKLVLLMVWAAPVFAAQTYRFDPDHSYVVWSVNHFGFSKITGKFSVKGTLNLDIKKPQLAKVQGNIKPVDVATGRKKFDNTLQGRSYFYTKKYPLATFISKRVRKTGKMTARVYGVLTIREVSKNVVLNMRMVKKGKHPFFHREAISFVGTTTLNRSEFNMPAYIPGISDKVELKIVVETILEAKSEGG